MSTAYTNHQFMMHMYADVTTRNLTTSKDMKETVDSVITRKKSIASDLSDKGSNITGKYSVMSAQTGLMFKCFDSIYGAQRILSNIKERSSVYGGSIKGGTSFVSG